MTNLHKDSAEGSGLFTHTTTWIDGKPVERVVARCTGENCHQIIDKTAPRSMPVGQQIKYLSDRGWQTHPILCPSCRRKRREKPHMTFNPAVPVFPAKAPQSIPDVNPAQAPKVDTPSQPPKFIRTEVRVHVSGKEKDARFHYVLRCIESHVGKHLYASVYVYDGRFVIVFGSGSNVSPAQGRFSAVRSSVSQGTIPPRNRISTVSLEAVFDGKVLVTESYPPQMTPIKFMTAHPSAISEALRKSLPPKKVYPPQPTKQDLPKQEQTKQAKPPTKPIQEKPQVLHSDPQVRKEAFSDADVRALLDLVRQCQALRPDIKFEFRDGKIIAKKTTYVDIY